MYRNPYAVLRELLPEAATQAGVVQSYADGAAVILVLGGGLVKAKGATTVGASVFFKGGQIIGPAPTLTEVSILI